MGATDASTALSYDFFDQIAQLKATESTPELQVHVEMTPEAFESTKTAAVEGDRDVVVDVAE